MKKLFATFCAIQSCMALTLTPHDQIFYVDGYEEDLMVSIDVNRFGDAVLAIGDEDGVKVAVKNGDVWDQPVVISDDFYGDSIEAKIDDEGNLAAFWESYGTLYGSKKEDAFWSQPQYIVSSSYPYEVNAKGEVLYLEIINYSYQQKVYLKKNMLGMNVSVQPLGPIEGWYYGSPPGVIAKNLAGNHLFLWKDHRNNEMQFHFVYEKDGMFSDLESTTNLLFDFEGAWDLKAAYSSGKEFCLLGAGWAEWTDYDDWICGTFVESPGNYHSQILALDDEVDDIAIAVDPNDAFLIVWEGKEGISASTLCFDVLKEVEAPAPSLFLEKISIKNGDFYFQPDPEGGFTLIWQQSIFDRENREIEYALYACRLDPQTRTWTEKERLTPAGTAAFLKGFATGPNGDRLVVWTEWADEGVQLRVGSLN